MILIYGNLNKETKTFTWTVGITNCTFKTKLSKKYATLIIYDTIYGIEIWTIQKKKSYIYEHLKDNNKEIRTFI